MKNRSRLLPSEPHDDWVEESWTVDCSCGVTFDDGEEMVDCDECGVWVHTRCSRYVKSEKSFSCDKCKSKNNNGGAMNDSEETEVAEFLVELPTKTLRMEKPNPASLQSLRPPVPMEERVHVQGVPGGDPGLFSEIKMSSIFGPQLWKSTGYVPKKFNFRYTEFPGWGDGGVEEKMEEENDKIRSEGDSTQADNGAGVLCSLSKENGKTLITSVGDFIGSKNSHEVSPRLKKKLDCDNSNITRHDNSLKGKSSVELQGGKRKKEEFRTSKVQIEKKKARTNEKEGDVKTLSGHALKAVASKISKDAEQLEFSRNSGSNAVTDDIQCATDLTSNEAMLRKDVSCDEISRERIKRDKVHTVLDNFCKSSDGVASLTEVNGLKEEVTIDAPQSCPDIGGGTESIRIGSHEINSVSIDVTFDAGKSKDVKNSNIDESTSCPRKKLKAELGTSDVELDTMKALTQNPESTACLFSEESKLIESSVTSVQARKRSSGLKKQSSKVAEESSLKPSSLVSNHSTSYQRKVVVSVARSDSIKSKLSVNRTAEIAQNPSANSKKDNSSADIIRDREKISRPKKLVKEPSNPLSKISHPTKLPHSSDSKIVSSDSKDSTLSSSKVSPVPNVTANPSSVKCASPPEVEGTSNLQTKAASQITPGTLPFSKANVASMTAPVSSNITATLSDEELALRLHQELNSSPRVPRVPRTRHASNLPQLTCPNATTMLMKRTSSNRGNDNDISSRKKMKEYSGKGSHAPQAVDNATKKSDKKTSSPDNRRQDSGYSKDRVSRKEANGGGSVKVVKTNASSSLSSSSDVSGHNLSSSRTLPGLISGIMSEGKRMTYEELCNDVLPHWPHLRKHNGERYAYSSHSQAVLDCLRNRSEWAQLVDRGPKTSSGSRKRQKADADSTSVDSEEDDEEKSRGKNAKEVGRKSLEEFPKGKRNARKRRRIVRGIVRRRRRADVVSDDESESYSSDSSQDNNNNNSSINNNNDNSNSDSDSSNSASSEDDEETEASASSEEA